jgi:transcription elongation factor SPT5
MIKLSKKLKKLIFRILSAICFDSLKGYVYIEAFKEANVREAIQGISALRENSIKVVPISEMTHVFQYDKVQKVDIKPKQWVRIKSGIYEGDLAQVILIEDPINKIYVRLIPRIPEDQTAGGTKYSLSEYNKKLKKSIKPRQKLFNPKNYTGVETKSHPIGTCTAWNKQTFKDGFLIKQIKAKMLITEDVIPKIEELRIFDLAKYKKNEDDENAEANPHTMDIDYLINTIQETEISKKKKFNKGDKVKLNIVGFNGVTGKVVSHHDKIVEIIADIEGVNDVLEFSEDHVVKNFLPGDMVRVVNGPNIGKQGLIVKIEDDTAIVFSEATMMKIKVSCHDLVSASHQNYETDYNPYYQLGDLVRINGTNTVCYVLDVQKYTLKLIDTRSEIKNVSVKDVSKLTNL